MLVNEAIASNKKKKSKALKHFMQAKCNKWCYTTFCQHAKLKSSGSLAYVTTQESPEQQLTTILDKEELDDTLLEYSQQHFAKVHPSPFTIEPLLCLLQYDGLSPFGDRVFQGHNNYGHIPFDKPAWALLKNM